MDLEVLNCKPEIRIYENFLTPDESLKLYNHDWKFNRSSGYDFASAKNKVSDYRTSQTTIDDGTCQFLTDRAVKTLKLDFPSLSQKHFETPQIQMYSEGEQYREHCDFFNYPSTQHTENDRVATLIIYLNDDFEGGNTTFTHLAKTVRPRQGSALYFRYDYGFEINYLTMHSGDPVNSGCKKIITLWMRENPWTL